MTDTNLIWILIGAVAVIALIWIIRSRSANPHDPIESTGSPEEIAPVTVTREAVIEPVARASEPAATAPAAQKPVPAPEPAPFVQPAPLATPQPAPKAAEAENVASPAATETTRPAEAPITPPVAVAEGADDLLRMKGIGPKLAALLASLGVTSFAQIAAWNDADIERIDAQLGNFRGRIQRDKWVEQAGFLARGDIAGFEALFGKLDR